jgi:hemerythrin
MRELGYPLIQQHTQAHEELREAFLRNLRLTMRGDLEVNAFIQKVKYLFECHEYHDNLFIKWHSTFFTVL